MNRKVTLIIQCSVLVCTLIFLITGCGTLRTARIRKEVTLSTHRNPEFRLKSKSIIAVIPLATEEKSLSGISFSANEAATEMLSVKLWNEGFKVIDKIFIKEVLVKERKILTNYTVHEAVYVGEKLGADYVMLTSLTELEEDTHSINFGPFKIIHTVDTSVLVGMNCRMVDVAEQRIVWSGVGTTQDKNLQLALRRISLRLIYSLHNGARKPKDRAIPIIGIHY